MLLCTLEAVDGGLCLLEISVVLDVPDVPDVQEEQEKQEMLDVPESMCCLLLRLLGMLEVDGRTRDDALRGQKSSRRANQCFRTSYTTAYPSSKNPHRKRRIR